MGNRLFWCQRRGSEGNPGDQRINKNNNLLIHEEPSRVLIPPPGGSNRCGRAPSPKMTAVPNASFDVSCAPWETRPIFCIPGTKHWPALMKHVSLVGELVWLLLYFYS